MSSGKSTLTNRFLTAIIAGSVLAAFASCTIVKKYPHGKPFVYKTNINLIGSFSKAKKEELENGLRGQLDDSMRVRKLDKLLWSVMKSPPVYDSVNADNSITFMRALLVSLGYFSDSSYYKTTVKLEKPDQYRTTVDFYVRPGKLVTLDSIGYDLRQPELQRLADSTRPQAFIKKGDAFAKIPISAELDRLTELYRNNGYLRFSRDEMIGLWDTLDVSLLQPSLDPFEQLEILQQLRDRRLNPTANLEIRLKAIDSIRLTKYYIGNITIYPDYSADTIGLVRKETVMEGVTIIQYHHKFKPKIFAPNIYLHRDSIYRQQTYVRTINRFNAFGTWRLVNIDQLPRANQDTVDFVIRLTPAKKYLFNTNLEGSINQSAISGNLFGIGVNVGVQNRNFARGANLTNTNLRYGIELGTSGNSQFIQTQTASFSHTIYFPRFIPNFTRLIPENLRDNFKTFFTFNAATTERRLLYNLATLNAAWGYEFQRRKKLLTIKFPNIEYSFLNQRDSLTKLIAANPSLKNIFTDGFIASIIANFTVTGGTTN
ncbi:MAG TPA: hypothetical protein VK644_05960, partial [Chitinophagaceae bacterium]|nr:hypothetical protein [Chitinophagaceae bacterium]